MQTKLIEEKKSILEEELMKIRQGGAVSRSTKGGYSYNKSQISDNQASPRSEGRTMQKAGASALGSNAGYSRQRDLAGLRDSKPDVSKADSSQKGSLMANSAPSNLDNQRNFDPVSLRNEELKKRHGTIEQKLKDLEEQQRKLELSISKRSPVRPNYNALTGENNTSQGQISDNEEFDFDKELKKLRGAEQQGKGGMAVTDSEFTRKQSQKPITTVNEDSRSPKVPEGMSNSNVAGQGIGASTSKPSLIAQSGNNESKTTLKNDAGANASAAGPGIDKSASQVSNVNSGSQPARPTVANPTYETSSVQAGPEIPNSTAKQDKDLDNFFDDIDAGKGGNSKPSNKANQVSQGTEANDDPFSDNPKPADRRPVQEPKPVSKPSNPGGSQPSKPFAPKPPGLGKPAGQNPAPAPKPAPPAKDDLDFDALLAGGDTQPKPKQAVVQQPEDNNDF